MLYQEDLVDYCVTGDKLVTLWTSQSGETIARTALITRSVMFLTDIELRLSVAALPMPSEWQGCSPVDSGSDCHPDGLGSNPRGGNIYEAIFCVPPFTYHTGFRVTLDFLLHLIL